MTLDKFQLLVRRCEYNRDEEQRDMSSKMDMTVECRVFLAFQPYLQIMIWTTNEEVMTKIVKY